MQGYSLAIIILIILFWFFVNSRTVLGILIRWAIIIFYSVLIIHFLKQGSIKSSLILLLTLIVCFAPLMLKKISRLMREKFKI